MNRRERQKVAHNEYMSGLMAKVDGLVSNNDAADAALLSETKELANEEAVIVTEGWEGEHLTEEQGQNEKFQKNWPTADKYKVSSLNEKIARKLLNLAKNIQNL